MARVISSNAVLRMLVLPQNQILKFKSDVLEGGALQGHKGCGASD